MEKEDCDCVGYVWLGPGSVLGAYVQWGLDDDQWLGGGHVVGASQRQMKSFLEDGQQQAEWFAAGQGGEG